MIVKNPLFDVFGAATKLNKLKELSFIVPNNYYYRITSNGSSSAVWAELR